MGFCCDHHNISFYPHNILKCCNISQNSLDISQEIFRLTLICLPFSVSGLTIFVTTKKRISECLLCIVVQPVFRSACPWHNDRVSLMYIKTIVRREKLFFGGVATVHDIAIVGVVCIRGVFGIFMKY